MTLQSGKIHQGDCIELMQRVDTGSVDLVFADPPFNIGYEYDQYDDRQDDQKYLDWCREWIAQVHRILKPTGTFWLAIGDEYAAELKIAAQREVGFHTRSWVIWYYTFGVNCKYKFSRSHVHLFHFVKNPKKFTFNAGDPLIRVPSARALVYGDKRADPDGRLPDDTWILRPQDFQSDRYGFTPDQDTWFFSRVAGTFKERKGFHGCQMPEQLLGRIIRCSSNEGDLVLDPFSGSGTTLAVAKKLDRDYMGCEVSKEYVKSATTRLNAVIIGDPLDGPVDSVFSAPSTTNGTTLKSRQKQSNTGFGTSRPLTNSRKENAESLVQGVRDAFLSTHEGFSTDRVVIDPHLNEAYVKKCKRLGIPGDAADLNRLLFRLRKAGKLKLKFSPRRIPISIAEFEQYSFAAEMAWKLVHIEFDDPSLDEILCDPDKTKLFDDIAKEFSPGFRPVEYRWAALRIRKKGVSLRKSFNSSQTLRLRFKPSRSLHEIKLDEFRSQSGLYVIKDRNNADLFFDSAHDLGHRLEVHRQYWRKVCELASRFAVILNHDIEDKEMLKSKMLLVARRNPLLNQDLSLVKS